MLKFVFAIQWPILPDSGRIDLIEYSSIPRVTNFMTDRHAARRAAGAASSTRCGI